MNVHSGDAGENCRQVVSEKAVGAIIVKTKGEVRKTRDAV